MASANNQFNVENVDFDGIKRNLKEFVASKTEFADYNFEGSTINYLLDILAYDTYMRSIYTNMAMNEMFIDTAQVRSNVVSNAKKMGYVPRSAKAAQAKIVVEYIPSDNPSSIVLPAGTKFGAVKDGVRYSFSTSQEYLAYRNENGVYSAMIDIFEGTRIRQEIPFDANAYLYEIINENVDLSSLSIGIQPNAAFAYIEPYTRLTDLTTVTALSPIYHIQESPLGRYEISFGDDNLGKRPNNNAVVIMTYNTTSGAAANGIQTFTSNDSNAHSFENSSRRYTPKTIRTIEGSSIGRDKETIESIRVNSVNSFPTQGRLVVRKDFEDFVRSNYDFVQSINVWGGEDHTPAIYGKVLLCLKPHNGYALTQDRKNEIIYDMKKRNVMTIEPIIIDPVFTYIIPDITVYYDSTRTLNSSDQIYGNIQNAVSKYENSSLSGFDKSFKYSSFVRLIDDVDPAITSNRIDILFEKRFVPIYNSTISYRIDFKNAIKHPYDGYLGGLRSTSFRIQTSRELMHIADDGYGKLNLVYVNTAGNSVVFQKNIGTINYRTGSVIINSLYVTELERPEDIEIRLTAQPDNFDLTPNQNNILLLARPDLRIINNTNEQIVSSGVLDSFGNISPLYSNSLVG